MIRFDLGWLRQRKGEESPDMAAMARLHAERPAHDLKSLGQKYVKGLAWGWDQDDVILFGLLAMALAMGIAGAVGLLV